MKIGSLIFLSFLLFSCPLLSQSKFKVIIDPGHGGNNKGAIFGEIEEKELTLELSLKLKALFSKKKPEKIEVVFTRTEDTDFQIKNRVEMIEKIKPDLFISIHFNSQKFLTTNRGFEIYYPADILNKNTEELAKRFDRANRSFYYGSVFKELYFQANLHNTWKLPFNLFTQKYDLMMFDETTVPGLLLEIAYLTSPDDRACIENPEFIDDIAWYIFETIVTISGRK